MNTDAVYYNIWENNGCTTNNEFSHHLWKGTVTGAQSKTVIAIQLV